MVKYPDRGVDQMVADYRRVVTQSEVPSVLEHLQMSDGARNRYD